jgi:hypothetical protein
MNRNEKNTVRYIVDRYVDYPECGVQKYMGEKPVYNELGKSGQIYSNLYGWIFPSELDKLLAEGDQGKLQQKSQCSHLWKSYQGLLEQFEYCEHCNEKKV